MTRNIARYVYPPPALLECSSRVIEAEPTTRGEGETSGKHRGKEARWNYSFFPTPIHLRNNRIEFGEKNFTKEFINLSLFFLFTL